MKGRGCALPAAFAALAGCFALSLCVGRYPLTPADMLAALGGGESMAARVFLRLRLPRSFAAALTGACLGAGGCAYQAVFSNPLAAPDILGVSGGATLGAALSVVLLGGAAQPLFAFAGGLLALLATAALSGASGALHGSGESGARGTAGFVLAGVLVSALARAALSVLRLAAADAGELASIEFFTMGSLSGVAASSLPPMLAGALPGLTALFLLRRQLPLLSLPADEAAALGVRVGAMRAAVLGAATLAVSAVSAQVGVVAFAPLLAPHAARMLLGGRARGRLGLSALSGAALLLLADTAARLTPSELPVSVFTTALGVPLLAALMLRGAREADEC